MASRIKNFIARFKWYLLVIALTIPTFTTLLRPGFFPMHDDLQAMRIYQMELCFKSFEIPCRWVPDMGYQYGYPQFEYYGPLPYYIMTAGRFLGLSLFDSVKLGFILPLILGNLTMFLLASSLFGSWGGLLSAMAYGYLPFRASDLYSRGAMGETWAFVFLPLILYFTLRLFKKPGLKSSAALGLSLAALFVTHNISTLMFMPMLGLFSLVLLFFSKERAKIIKYGLLAAFWGLFAAGTFFLPVVFEKAYAHTESLIEGYFNYLAHFVTIKQLFLTSFWGYGSSEIGPTDDLSFFLGPVHMLLFLVVWVAAFVNYKKTRKLTIPFLTIVLSTFFLLLSVFMTHEKSSFIWQKVPLLAYLQFPWRFLVTAGFFLCLPLGYCISTLREKTTALFVSVMVVILFLLNVSYFRPRDWFDLTIWEKFSGLSWDKQLTISIFDYLPIYPKLPPANPAPQYPVSDVKVSYLDYQHGADFINFSTRSRTDAVLMVPQFDFPGWQVKVDGRSVSYNHDNQLGLISFALPAGDHRVDIRLHDSPVRLVGDLLTVVFVPLAIYVLIKKENHD